MQYEEWLSKNKTTFGLESRFVRYVCVVDHPDSDGIPRAGFEPVGDDLTINEQGEIVSRGYELAQWELLERVDTLFEAGAVYPDQTFKALDALKPGLGADAKKSYEEACRREYQQDHSTGQVYDLGAFARRLEAG